MIALITLVLPIGGDAGPFNLLSNTDGYTIPFEIGVSTAALVAGYTSIVVPEGTTTIRVVSTGICTNYIDIEISLIPTTTTTSSSSTSTTSTSTSTSTSTTSTSSTTTTTTTPTPEGCVTFIIQPPLTGLHTVAYYDCYGEPGLTFVEPGDLDLPLCALYPLVNDTNPELTSIDGACIPPSTTTTTTNTPPAPSCMLFNIFARTPQQSSFQYIPCGGGAPITITLSDIPVPSEEIYENVTLCYDIGEVPSGFNFSNGRLGFIPLNQSCV